jgi:IS5 family transposase
MGDQRTFASVAWNQKGKVTRRERFLAEMDAVIPWKRLIAVIEPHYAKAGNGRQPLGLEKMLRIYFLQQWFNLSNPAAEDAIYDSESMRRFARVELAHDVVPDETTILRFRHVLEKHRLSEAIFEAVKDLLGERRVMLKSGTMVDATIISAPSSTKNATETRGPGYEADAGGKHLVLRDEASRRDRQKGLGPQHEGDQRRGGRRDTVARAASRRRTGDLWRPRLLERARSANLRGLRYPLSRESPHERGGSVE